jgi:DNA-binding NtrC family response regulator
MRNFQSVKEDASQPASERVETKEDWPPLGEIEGRYVARVLEHTGGNKQAAARILAVDRKTLDRMIKRHHITKGAGHVPSQAA